MHADYDKNYNGTSVNGTSVNDVRPIVQSVHAYNNVKVHACIDSVGNIFTKNSSLLTCSLFNSRSIKNKMPDLHQFIYNNAAPKILFITETWLNHTISDAMIDPMSHYTIYRCDRTHRNGGGVLTLIDKTIRTVRHELSVNFPNVEGILIEFEKRVKFRILLIYRPPDHNIELMQEICNCIVSKCSDGCTTLVVGDFNCGKIDWINSLVMSDNEQLLFCDTVNDLCLYQFVDLYTRGESILLYIVLGTVVS